MQIQSSPSPTPVQSEIIFEALENENWKRAVKDEMEALENNKTWDLVKLPEEKKTVGCRWVLSVKYKSDGSLERGSDCTLGKYTLYLLKETGNLRCKPAETLIDVNHKIRYSKDDDATADRSAFQILVGRLIYLSHTRPDITYVVGVVSQFMHNAKESHLRVVTCDYAGFIVDRRSTSRYCTFFGRNLVTWRSKKQNVVARSSAKTKFRAMALGICELLWLNITLEDLKNKTVEEDKHFIKEKLDSGLICTPYVTTGNQVADILTKGLPIEKRKEERDKLKGKIIFGEVWEVFVDNLSRRVSRRELRELFSSQGAVERVFIPKETRNPKYKFLTFAFVQFERESGLNQAIDMLNGSLIDGRRITVGVAKYNDARPLIAGKNSPVKLVPVSSAIGPSKLKEIDFSCRSVRDDRSYKDALLANYATGYTEFHSEGSHREKVRKNILEMYISSESSSWVKRSLTGIIKLSIDFKSVKESLFNDGFEVQIASWGYARNSCIMTFNSHKEMMEAWTKKKDVISFWFDRLDLLLNKDGIPMAFCQVKLLGIPLLCWNESFLERIVGRWGDKVEIHDSTKNRDDISSPFFKNSPVVGAVGENFGELRFEDEEDMDFLESEESPVKSAEKGRQKVDFWLNEGASFGSAGSDGETLSPRFTKHGKGFSEGLSGPAYSINKFGKLVQIRRPTEESNGKKQLKGASKNSDSYGNKDVQAIESKFRLLAPNLESSKSHSRGRSLFVHKSSLSSKSEPLVKRRMPRYSRVYSRSRERKFWHGKAQKGNNFDGVASVSKSAKDQLCSFSQQIYKITESNLHGRMNPNSVLEIGVNGADGEPAGCSFSHSALNSRRVKILLLRDALEQVTISTTSSPDFLNLLDEAVATWQNLLVCVGGDFNVYLCEDEKIGGRFTWCNNQDDPTFVSLDKFLVDGQFLASFPEVTQSLIPKSISDHNVVFLHNGGSNWGNKPFRLFNYLMEEDGFDEMVNQTITYCKKLRRKPGILSILKNSELAIKQWAGKKNKFPGAAISDLENKIQKLEEVAQQRLDSSVQEIIEELSVCRSELWRLYRIEEQIWHQNSRQRWVNDGDRNTRYFHTCASVRRNQNALNGLKVDGTFTQDPDVIKATVKDHFFRIFNESSTLDVEDIGLTFPRISLVQSGLLEKDFSEEEVWETLKSCDSNKAPGPDGLNLGLFKRFWHVLKDDFRPISLVRGVYKILSKCLARRLRSCLGEIISPTQFSFIPGRQILDCSLIANEGIDYWRKKGLKGYVFKVDFKKAYDTVDWSILFMVMEKMGFGSTWIGWIKKCVTTASISVLVNGVPSEEFEMAKGLRQGCSLYPLLFNLVGELLNLLILRVVLEGLFSGLKVGLPLGATKNSSFIWDLVVQNFQSKLAGWRAATLSLAGRLVLIKSVLCSLPTFFLSMFKIPTSIFKSLNSIMANFLWGGGIGKNKIHWVNWEEVCKPKNEGGLGVRNLSCMNRALLGKWSWRKTVSLGNSIHRIPRMACFGKVVGDGIFSVSSCVKSCATGSKESQFWLKIVWRGVVPPKAETFLWQIVKQKLAVKSELIKRGVQGIDDVLCPLCKKVEESSSHLFFTCPVVWLLWNKFLQFWNFSSVLHADAKMFLLCWDELKSNSTIWSFIPGAIIWTIWKTRNFIVFEGGKLDQLELFFLARVRLASWFLAKYKDISIPKDSLIYDPSLGDLHSSCNFMKSSVLPWLPPPIGFIKLNVDAATTSDWLKSGLGGILRDHSRAILGSFQEPDGPGPLTLKELKAIQRGLIFVASIQGRDNVRLIVESDNKIAVDWINIVDFYPVLYAVIVKDIVDNLRVCGGIVRWVARSANSDADALAKAVIVVTVGGGNTSRISMTGYRKIVLATNIAESSITIDDVVYVIDCGKAKETSYDALNKLACLLPSWISKASARQRQGRAGRVQPGVCYRLYPKLIHDANHCKKELTPLGRHLCTLPLDPNIGKMLLMGAIFQCLNPALTIAAAFAHRDPFVLPINRKEKADAAKRSFAGDSCSDHIAVLKAFEGYRDAKRNGRERAFCWKGSGVCCGRVIAESKCTEGTEKTKVDSQSIDEKLSNLVVICLLGKKIGYRALLNRIQVLWKLVGEMQLVDLDNEYFIARITQRRLLVWVRLPGLPYHYYTRSLLRTIARIFGDIVQIDYNTTEVKMGRFARLAIIVILDKPLVPDILIDGRYQLVEYEGLPTICYAYGKFGHAKEGCGVENNTYDGSMKTSNQEGKRSMVAGMSGGGSCNGKVVDGNKVVGNKEVDTNITGSEMVSKEWHKVDESSGTNSDSIVKVANKELAVNTSTKKNIQIKSSAIEGNYTTIQIGEGNRRRVLGDNNGRGPGEVVQGSNSKQSTKGMSALKGLTKK
ncbi:hypothetical protein F3Y22_tig00110065pilonHSYRG00307 [Hibiscus syriacus]|uniref:Uncharacterized protein n=1 Tax=Hibiscus syriacus TaxID=106335 RepID=A0A6A3BJ48_HIBSY|nr:hypothetical protein F3Y22_tig00110065pilonHSYRG00307 [Hibiscus syriacus]